MAWQSRSANLQCARTTDKEHLSEVMIQSIPYENIGYRSILLGFQNGAQNVKQNLSGVILLRQKMLMR